MKLQQQLALDSGLQKLFLGLCAAEPLIFFKTCLWTFNPRQRQGLRNLPFITRPQQDLVIHDVCSAIRNSYDLLVDKSRDEGATCLITACFLYLWLLVPDSMFLVGSRKEEFVDRTGDHKTLFAKLVYMHNHLPAWMQVPVEKTHMHYENLSNGSVIDGEATNENFGAGDRRTAVLIDEFGRVDHSIAQNIRDNLSDVTDCVIYNSTHFYGAGHPYNKLLQSGKVKVVTLPWEKNPEKAAGLYRSPDLNVIEIKDIDYYRKRFPRCFDRIMPSEPFKLSELEVDLLARGLQPKVNFVADGGQENEGGWRSPWYDAQCLRRDRRDIAQNIDRSPMGSGDMFFDQVVLRRIRLDCVCDPRFVGEIEYTAGPDGRINGIPLPKFAKNAGRRRLAWWGELRFGRPRQDHNYVITCDISLGVGASNSVASIYDVNQREKIGMFVCPNSPPESFADVAVALCYWVGGLTRKAYLAWEANGPGGSFEKRILFHGYDFVYMDRNQRDKHRQKTNYRGWNSNRQSKYDLLLELRIALSEGLKTNSQHKRLIIHDLGTVQEYENYVFYENGDIGLSTCIDEESGARSAHGDRVIPDGLFVLTMNEQPAAAVRQMAKAYPGSYSWRRLEFDTRTKQKKNQWHD